MKKYSIHPDIAKAETLPASFYRDQETFENSRDSIFSQSWHWIGDKSNLLPLDGYAYPFNLVDGFIEEPLILVANQDGIIRCMSNVCTHRANLVVHHPGKVNNLSCMYHGRRWAMDGSFKFVKFKQAHGKSTLAGAGFSDNP